MNSCQEQRARRSNACAVCAGHSVSRAAGRACLAWHAGFAAAQGWKGRWLRLMPRNAAYRRWLRLLVWHLLWCSLLISYRGSSASAVILVAKNGMLFEGAMAELSSIDQNPLVVNVPEGGVQVNQIVVLDDGLRRTFLSWLQIQPESTRESDPVGNQVVRIRQRVATGRRYLGAVNSILRIGPFDQWGRRTFSVLTPLGRQDIVQGITQITPVYTQLQGLHGTPSIRWDCRVATSSIPRQTLSQVIRLQSDIPAAEARRQAVMLLFAAERYLDAQIELTEAIQEFPELGELQGLLEELRQLSASRLVDEIKLRQESGQHQRVRTLLQHFPEEGIATQTLLSVSELLRQYEQGERERQQLVSGMEALLAGLSQEATRSQLAPMVAEVKTHLNQTTVSRLQDYVRLRDDPNMLDESRLALALSGWLLGSGNASQNLMEVISLFRVRELVVQYLRSEQAGQRQAILEQLGREEGGVPSRVAQIVQQMIPPWETPSQEVPAAAGHFVIDFPGPSEGATLTYEVQLPDEYDPYRRYPTIVSLHATGSTPAEQLDWWAGGVDARFGRRVGQAGRHGYIVIAPHWSRPNQRRYEYTGREHAAVLGSLRDACRRFSVDTDRVFLSGHSVGGDAAWDIGLAHPDLWAGVIPIVASAEYGGDAPKYVSLYWENARNVPLYFVTGELDGKKLELNRRDFDRYLKTPGIDATIVEYIGRGHEHFYDEIHRLFTWMNLHRREFVRQRYEYHTMRPFDNFCWNLELQGLPAASMVKPLAWPVASARPSTQGFEKTAVSTLIVRTGAEQAWLYLSPELIELSSRLGTTVNGQTRAYDASPSVAVILEDARTRVDRQHVFWTRVELVTGKRNSR